MAIPSLLFQKRWKRFSGTIQGTRLSSKREESRDFWIINTRGLKGAHFAVYPEELLHRPVLASSRVGDIVIDPFIGSGTTAVVAKKLGRRFLGCDINSRYVRIAKESQGLE